MSERAAIMALPEPPATRPPTRPARTAFGRAVATVLFFAVFGPLIGGAIVAFADIAGVVAEARDLAGILYFLVAFGAVAVPAAYAMGFVPAALVGLFFAAVDFGQVRSAPWLAVVIGALGGVLWPAALGQPPATLSSPLEVHILLASIVSTFLCWFLSTRGPRRREDPPA